MAAEPLVMVAGNQQTLIGRRAGDHPRNRSRNRRAGVRRHRASGRSGTCRRAAGRRRDALDELRGLVDPAMIQHCAGMQEHQPGRTRLPWRRPPAPPRAFPRGADNGIPRRRPPARSRRCRRDRPAALHAPRRRPRPAPVAASVATAVCSHPSVGMMTLSMTGFQCLECGKRRTLSACHVQISRRIAAFCGSRRATTFKHFFSLSCGSVSSCS